MKLTNKVIDLYRKSDKDEIDMRFYKKIDDDVVFGVTICWGLVYFLSTVASCFNGFLLFGYPVLTYVLLRILVWRDKLVVIGSNSDGFALYWHRRYSPLVQDDTCLYNKIINFVAKRKGFIPKALWVVSCVLYL